MAVNKILIVDDSATSRLLFRAHMAEDKHLQIEEAENKVEALKKSSQFQPDIIFMDYSLPDGNGIEIAREIQDSGSSAQFVLLSATSDNSVIKQATEIGFIAFLDKPITRAKVAAILNMI